MSDRLETSLKLSGILKNTDVAYLRVEPEVLDFTRHAAGKLIIETTNGQIEVEIDRNNVKEVAGLLDATVFDNEQLKMLLCWNIKPLFTYMRYYLGKDVIPKSSVVDLYVIEGFLNLNKKRPENIGAAINRSKACSKYKSWTTVYRKIHLPFIFRVLPGIETTPLLDTADKVSKHPYYEIEGQVNGRLNCLKRYSRGYMPHNVGPDQRKSLKPSGESRIFLSADFRHCEVTVLQWLSKDEILKEILETGEDLYKELYRIITGDDCNTDNKRNISKKMFLPVMYGLGGRGLSNALSCPEEMGVELVDRIRKKFPTANRWMHQQQETAKKHGFSTDYLGRPRRYGENEHYLVRNFAVQGVAASVCQEKTIQLFNNLSTTNSRICYTVHDGYVISCPIKEAKDIRGVIKDTLESESTLCLGLQMKVEMKYGMNLYDMKVMNIGG